MDMLRMDYINNLGQLYIQKFGDTGWWPLYGICVQTGCLNYDVCGLLDHGHIGEVKMFKDDAGNLYDPDTFYIEYEEPQK